MIQLLPRRCAACGKQIEDDTFVQDGPDHPNRTWHVACHDKLSDFPTLPHQVKKRGPSA